MSNLIFDSLEKFQYRIPQKKIISFIIMCFQKEIRFCYRRIFRFIANTVDIKRIDDKTTNEFISVLCNVMRKDTENPDDLIDDPDFLIVLRKQNPKLTGCFDEIAKNRLPDFYYDIYMTETSDNARKNISNIIERCVDMISDDNKMQGKNGHYYVRSQRNHHMIRTILSVKNYVPSNQELVKIVSTSIETFLDSNESIIVKTDAVELLTYIVINYKDFTKANIDLFKRLVNVDFSMVTCWGNNDFISNLEKDVLELAFRLLRYALGIDEYLPILNLLTKTTMNDETKIKSIMIIDDFVTGIDKRLLSSNKMISIFLMYALSCLGSNLSDVRLYSTSVLLKLSFASDYKTIINRQMVELINNDNYFIKNFIQRNISRYECIDKDTRQYIYDKCSNDDNFVVRLVHDKFVVHSVEK